MMRITGGVLRGRTLIGQVPPGVRPTAAKVREALFSMIGQDLEGHSLLDAFGGMGLFAFEAFSRGAAPITIVEHHRRTAEGIRAQAAHLGVPIDLRVDDARKILDAPGAPWDIIFLDPPYAEDPLPWAQRAAPRAATLLTPDEVAGLTALLAAHEQDEALKADMAYFQQEGDLDFHYRIIQGSHNTQLTQLLIGELYHRIRMYRYQVSAYANRPQKAFGEHQRIAEAIEARDGDLAEMLMRRHISSARQNIEKHQKELS
jgi:16S rRNA (guanine(966)-N(2))-methyltransferase RsmD